jgi:thioredoxin-related protein
MEAKKKSGSRDTVLVLIVLLTLAAASSSQEPPPEHQSPPVHSPGNAEWASTFGEAAQRAAAQGKFLFVEFDKQGCGHCQRMDALLYPAFDFEALLIPMVPVKLSLDSSDGKELARQYGIADAPAILIRSPEGRMVFLVEGFTTTQDFYAHVRQDLDEYRAFAKKIEAQDIPRLSAREALETGKELYRRGDSAGALPRLKRAVSAPAGTTAAREDARELLAAVELDGGDTAASRQTIQRLITTTKDARRRERAELFRAQIPLAENKPEEAYALFVKFEKDHPKSPYLSQVRALIARMTGEARKP